MFEVIRDFFSSKATLFNSRGLAQLEANLATNKTENALLRYEGYSDYIDDEEYRRWRRPDGSEIDRSAALMEIGVTANSPLAGIELPHNLTKE
jgi:hypothetical protein